MEEMKIKNIKNTDEKELLFSLIIPVYNSEKWLDELFTSLLDQGLGHDEYEIICVNDGSTDNSGEILEEYAQKYPCIRVIHQENARQAAARNRGLQVAKGRYVWFIDSDDYISTNALRFIASVMDEHQIDEFTVSSSGFLGDKDGYKHEEIEYVYEPLKEKPELETCSGVKIFRRSIIAEHNIAWEPKLSLCDDVWFLYQFELFAKKDVAIKTPIYHYRQRLDSTSHSHTDVVLDKHLFSIKLLGEKYEEILKNPPYPLSKQQKKNLQARINLCTQTLLYDLAIKGDTALQNEILSELKQAGRYPYKHIWWNLKPKISLKRTVYDMMMFFFPHERLYRFLGKRLKKKYDKKHRTEK
ncbi:MAG: glycosyltransferase [Clostridia bacterium]|nr:glycosyltransferase [Clostridia bacterium]